MYIYIYRERERFIVNTHEYIIYYVYFICYICYTWVSALGASAPESLHYYNTFRMHISETTINTDSKSKACTPIGHFELLAEVL